MNYIILGIFILIVILLVFIRNLIHRLAFPIEFNQDISYEGNVHPDTMLVDGIGIIKVGWNHYTQDKPIIVVSHGNGHNLDKNYYHILHKLSETTGLPVISWDYPGYGLSDGIPNQETINDQYSKLIKNLNHPIDKLILIGQSIGTGHVTWYASNHKCHCVILITPFTSIVKIILPFSIPFIDAWNSEDCISKIQSPVLIFGALYDNVIPFEHSKILSDNCKNCKFIVKKTGHNDIDWNYDVNDFIKSVKL